MTHTRHRAPHGALVASIALVAFALAALSGCAHFSGQSYMGAPTILPGVTPEMNRAGYWISRHPSPDAPILLPEDIARLNDGILQKKLVNDLAAPMSPAFPAPTTDDIRKEMSDARAWIASLRVYDKNGARINPAKLPPPGEPYAEPLYCLTVSRTDLRVLPTDEPLFDAPDDPYVDNLQASDLDVGTPFIALGESADGQWLYARTELASGWIRKDAVAFTRADAFLARLARQDTLIATAAKAELWLDPAMTRSAGYVRMGTRLIPKNGAVTDPDTALIEVCLPTRAEDGSLGEISAWVVAADVSQKPLPFTARSVYDQAFKLLNAPYGWGGMFGEQDCSQFLCEVFATMGVRLPRNSTKQGKTGVAIEGIDAKAAPDAKATRLAEAGIPAATLLRLPGHIMLYLGQSRGEAYAIHETLGYRERLGLRETTRLVNRVTVSTLSLGKGTKKTSHLERLTTAVIIAPPGQTPAEETSPASIDTAPGAEPTPASPVPAPAQ